MCSGQLDVESLSPVERDQLKQTLYAEHLPTRQIDVEARNPLVDELSDFKSSIRSGNKPRVTGEQARDALAIADQILQQINGRLEWGSCWPYRPPDHLPSQPSCKGRTGHPATSAIPRPANGGSAAV